MSLKELVTSLRENAHELATMDVSAYDNLGVIDSRLKAIMVADLLSTAGRVQRFIEQVHERSPRTVTPRH
jgi:hypothetical protein